LIEKNINFTPVVILLY